MRLIILGSTGLVGRHLLDLALANPDVSQIVAPVRRAIPAQEKLFAPVVDFDCLPDAPWWQADAIVCALGTTMRKAGSQQAFRRIDHDYPLLVARLGKQNGVNVFVLNSALGANAQSLFFYNRVKGETERDLQALGFGSLTFVRPGLIGGMREERRPVERMLQILFGAIGPVLPSQYRINPAQKIAQAMLDAALAARPGVHAIASDLLV
ncbi:MAG: hypothetical protein RL735_381 [Pseudomonadota bacterium]